MFRRHPVSSASAWALVAIAGIGCSVAIDAALVWLRPQFGPPTIATSRLAPATAAPRRPVTLGWPVWRVQLGPSSQ
jgi:hypothetical protein